MFQNERLFGSLRIFAGKRQFVISGKRLDTSPVRYELETTQDLFMQNMQLGIGNLNTALEEYLKEQDFEIIVIIESLSKPRFLTEEMERRFREIVRGESVDPRAQGANTRTFTPRDKNRSEEESTVTPVASAEQARAERTAVEISNAGSNSEQNFLEQLTRLLSSPTKNAVVFYHPHNMWAVNPTENDLQKLDTIFKWGTITDGHPESMSILVVTPERMAEFDALSKRRWDSTPFIRHIELTKPDKREFEATLMRFACRYGYFGHMDKLAATAHAKCLTLRKFVGILADYVNNNPETRSLDKLFDDGSQTETFDELKKKIKGLIGLTDVKKEIDKIVNEAEYAEEQRRLGKKIEDASFHMFLLGPPGTGKSMVARLLAQIFWALELRQSREVVEISYADIVSENNEGETVKNMRNAIQKAAGGVFFIDKFYLFAEHPWGRKALQILVKEMEDNRDSLTVIFAGYEERLPELFNVDPGIKDCVNRYLRFPDYTVDEMLAMFEKMAHDENQMILTDEAKAKLHRYIDSFAKRGGIGNGREVRNLFEKMKGNRAVRRAETPEILPDDLPDPISFKEAEARKIIEELNQNFIGLPRVKKFFEDMFKRQRSNEMQGKTVSGTNHCVFLGPPGTGKTSVARQMGNLFYALGLVSDKNKFKEVGLDNFTSQYQGEYAQKVRDIFDEALGGVLFIDEAYRFARDEQGRKIIDQIVQMFTNPAYANLVVVLAGYENEIQELYAKNPGLKSRIAHTVPFDNFEVEELKTIFYRCAERDNKMVAPSEQDRFDAQLQTKLAGMARTRNFGNARSVEKLYRDIVEPNYSNRLLNTPEADKTHLMPEDLEDQGDATRETIEDIMRELDEKFVGMDSLKKELRRLTSKIHAERKQAELTRSATSSIEPGQYNMRFVGNPGTGKTTIARYMARILYSLGIVEHPQIGLEYRGVDLQGSFLGQTKDKVNDIFEKNAGRVVIIDEVYSVLSQTHGNTSMYGQEAIDALVGCITDQRNATTVIIVAGYKDKMDAFLTSNRGLTRRFGMEITFPDYTDEECVQILYRMLSSAGFIYPDTQEFPEQLVGLFSNRRRQMGTHFGNAGTVASVFDEIKKNQAERLDHMDNPTDQDWLTILAEDIPRNQQQ